MNVNGYCPKCNAGFDGDLVVETFIKQGQSKEEALKGASYCAGWNEYGEKNRWGRQICLYSFEMGRTYGYRCPDCGYEWKR